MNVKDGSTVFEKTRGYRASTARELLAVKGMRDGELCRAVKKLTKVDGDMVTATLHIRSLDPILVSDPWLWLDGLQSQFTICIRFAMERGCWLRGLMVCGAWWGWGGGAIGIQKATLMSCRLTPRFDTRRALEYPMLSDVRMQLRRSRQNRTFARQGSGQNSRAHP